MGLLSHGTPLSWEETQRYTDHVRNEGIRQFIHTYHANKSRDGDEFLWGDELEYLLVEFDNHNKKARLSLRAWDVLQTLLSEEETALLKHTPFEASWRPEYARYMMEGIPSKPFGSSLKELSQIEANMRSRRQSIRRLLRDNESLVTMPNFPLLGATHTDFLTDMHNFQPGQDPVAQSLFIPDAAITPHARFPTLTRNIRLRRQRPVLIHVPLFKDRQTPQPFHDTLPLEQQPSIARTDHIAMDCMCFGMGCCCLQITCQLSNLTEARYIYDQLAVLAPILLAMTAATPIFRGHLVDRDSRWDVIAASVDDRLVEEDAAHSDVPLRSARFKIPKSRYESVSAYLSEDVDARFNDLTPFVFDRSLHRQLCAAGIDDRLARHVAHLFIRDPLVIYREYLDQRVDSLNHFENIQSTNWQTVRFKPPYQNMGWRVEFRPMEVQLTDTENAAMTVFMVLLIRTLLARRCALTIPLSLVDDNMRRAQQRDALTQQSFHFRSSLSDPHASVSMLSIDTIIHGGDGFEGLLPMIRSHLQNTSSPEEDAALEALAPSLTLISERASGRALTGAQYLRRCVEQHPLYRHDSRISDAVNYDLLQRVDQLGRGVLRPSELLGSLAARTASPSKDGITPLLDAQVKASLVIS